MIHLFIDKKHNIQYNFRLTRPLSVCKSVTKSVTKVRGKRLKSEFFYEPL